MMAKMTISVPDDLRAEMDRLNWINWSHLFANAAASAILKAESLNLEDDGLESLRQKRRAA